MAYCWVDGAWNKIGEMTGKGAAQKKKYDGDPYFPAGQYDDIVDVELEGAHFPLPVNKN